MEAVEPNSRTMPPPLTPNNVCWHLQLVKTRTPARHRDLAGDTVQTTYSHTTKEDMVKGEMREMQARDRNSKYQVSFALALPDAFDTPTCYSWASCHMQLGQVHKAGDAILCSSASV